MDENEKHLLSIRDEMENVRELYVKGYIDKETYQLETRNFFELAVKYIYDRKDIEQIKNLIKKFNEYFLKEKNSLSESIESFG